ncbi:MFS transporter [Rhizocola hellebori]|uniref:MFS transporter n=1 Tax=Rhizocola hellebori TaxID=1392758 RepID=A0A8J3QB48_9ACTN|nr:MFS transporter [Rhizocola hellebori]GIH07578.1 MFS transporter [Rhizocola hellebori]
MSGRSATGVLLATSISALVVNANTSAVTILLPAISADTGTPVSTLQWAVTGYSLVGAAVIVTAGALGDIFGRRKVFLAGLLLFIVSCVLIALAQSGEGVIAGRCIQGAAGSTILACGMSLISVANEGKARLRAVSLWGAASAVGAAAGPLVGGVLVDTTGWQGLFWIDAAIAAACVPLTLITVGESKDPHRSKSIDYAGTILVAVVLAPIIFGLTEGSTWGWLSVKTIGCFLISIAAAVGFVFVERRVKAPLIDLALLRNTVLVGATLSILVGSGAINGIMYAVSLYFQNPATLNMSAMDAGLATLPVTAAAVILAPLITPIVGKVGLRKTVAAGFVIMAVAFAALGFAKSSWAYGVFVLPLVGIAVGMSLQNGPASSVSTTCVPADQVGAASGISNMARYVGAAVMTALVAAVYTAVSTNRLDAGEPMGDALAAGLSRASIALAIISALSIGLARLVAGKPPKPETLHFAAAAASTSHTLPVAGPASAGKR